MAVFTPTFLATDDLVRHFLMCLFVHLCCPDVGTFKTYWVIYVHITECGEFFMYSVIRHLQDTYCANIFFTILSLSFVFNVIKIEGFSFARDRFISHVFPCFPGCMENCQAHSHIFFHVFFQKFSSFRSSSAFLSQVELVFI